MALTDVNQNYIREVERKLLTISGESGAIEIKIKISGSIEINCEVKGQLGIDGQLIIQKNGYVNADVVTTDAEIIGRYEGNMEASGNVEIKETGVVNGNIKTDSLIINKGGIFAGNVFRLSENTEIAKKKTKYSQSYKEAKEKFETVEQEVSFEEQETPSKADDYI
jgi:cytoskeletal protein CcmA (bactofilin family)